jgi:hypothetical protein
MKSRLLFLFLRAVEWIFVHSVGPTLGSEWTA